VDNPSRHAAAASTCLYDRLTWIIVTIIAGSYFFGLTPGHIFAQDDFGAYVMHAENLVQGRPYTQIHYVPNPEAWISPANGYPPAYPLLLAPVFWQRGLDLHAMKMATVFTFAIFLGAFAIWLRPLCSPRIRTLAVLLVGFSPALWTYRDFISSEFPYLMFSFLALLAIRRAASSPAPDGCGLGWALLVAALLYACYATRTIGIALPIALTCKELAQRKRFSRFMILTCAILAALIGLQAALLTSPSGYISVVRISIGSALSNLWSYSKSITFAWHNGFSKTAQGLLGLALTSCAAFAFLRRNRKGTSIEAWYLLVYMAILIASGIQIGIRGLLPILPIYLTYVVLGISDLQMRMRPISARIFVAAAAFCIVATYVGSLRQPIRSATAADVNDPSAQELFSFLRTQTAPSDLLVFSKPRTVSLFTSRMATALGPDEAPEDSARFLQSAGAQFLIQSTWNPPAYRHLIEKEGATMTEVFHNRDFQVLRFRDKSTTEKLASR